MILTAKKIAEEVATGGIKILPYRPEQLNPNSYDIRLDRKLVVYKPNTMWGKILHCLGMWVLDPASKNETEVIEIPATGYVLKPGTVYLAATEEWVNTDKYISVVDGKSSIGRLGLFIHVTAGYIDTGFKGQVTLELVATQPVRIYPGMRIGQIRYHEPAGEVTLYSGNYQNETSVGPVASRSWNQK